MRSAIGDLHRSRSGEPHSHMRAATTAYRNWRLERLPSASGKVPVNSLSLRLLGRIQEERCTRERDEGILMIHGM